MMLGALIASSADRLTEPGLRPGGGPARVGAFLLLGLLLHAALFGAAFLWEGVWSPTPEPEPISVELVEEAPPPEPPAPEKPREEPQQAQQTPPPAAEEQAKEEQQEPEKLEKAELPPTVPLDLPAAYDAPKSAQNDAELTFGDKAPEAPLAAALQEQKPPDPAPWPPEPPKIQPEQQPTPPEPVTAQAPPAPQEAPPVEPSLPDPDGVPTQAGAAPVEKAAPDKPEAPDAKRFAFFAPLPKMEFETSGKQSRAPSGNAESTYTSTLYGMIVPLVRVPEGLPPAAWRRPLRVEFVVDGQGRLAALSLTRSSGAPSLDLAAISAVRRAAPFPPTPHGKPLGLVLDYAPK